MKKLVELNEGELPLTHSFSDNVYAREIFMPKGQLVIGHVHTTRHLNIVSQGKAKVCIDGVVKIIEAPFTFESDAGVRKILFILEDMFWTTIHVTTETNIDILEDTLIDKTQSTSEKLLELIKNDIPKIGV